MLDYDEDIDVNEFYQHLQATCPAPFREATLARHTGSFDVKTLTRDQMLTHLLKTRLDNYDLRATISTYNDREVKLSDGNLETVSGFKHFRKVKVLFEVDYVNENDAVYKVLCVDRPLEGDCWAAAAASSHGGGGLLSHITTLEQCMDFLWSNSSHGGPHRKSRIKRKVDLLVPSVSNRVSRAESSDEISTLCDDLYASALGLLLKEPYFRRHSRQNFYFFEAMQLALETYLMGLLHDAVFTRLYNLHAEREAAFNKLYQDLSFIDHTHLNLLPKHCINLERASGELATLGSFRTPLEMAGCLDRVIHLLSHSPRPPNTSATSSPRQLASPQRKIFTSTHLDLSNSTSTLTESSERSSGLGNSIGSSTTPASATPTESNAFQLVNTLPLPVKRVTQSTDLAADSNIDAELPVGLEEEEKDVVVISSDELVPLVMLLVVHSQLPCWLTVLEYLNNFSLSGKMPSRASYAVTSFHAGVMFIESGKLRVDVDQVINSQLSGSDGQPRTALQQLFKIIEEGKEKEMEEFLKEKTNHVIEKLCHPLCECPKCQKYKHRSSIDGDHVTVFTREPDTGWTALHAAAHYGNVDALEKLIHLDYKVTSVSNKGQSPLHLACSAGHHPIAMLLICYHAPVNAVDEDGNTGLHLAAARGHLHVCVALMYQEGGDQPINLDAQNLRQETPLYLAAKFGHEEIVQELVLNGASVDINDRHGEGPLQVAHRDSIRSILAPRSNNRASVMASGFLLPPASVAGGSDQMDNSYDGESSTNASPQSLFSSDYHNHNGSFMSHSPSMTSISAPGQERRASYSMSKSMSVSSLTSEADNPAWFYSHQNEAQLSRKIKKLLALVRENRIDNVLYMLGAASRPEASGSTPIEYSHSLCHPKCDCQLCEKLRLSVVNPPHPYTLTVNSQDDVMNGGLGALHAAVISGYPEMCIRLMNQGASLQLPAPPSLNTPLHFACQYDRAEIASLLFEYGASGNVENRDGNRPLHLAASCGHEWPVTLVISVAHVDVNARNKKGDTALHLAVLGGYVEVTRRLLEANADPNIRNNHGKSPLDLVEETGNAHMCNAIKKHFTYEQETKQEQVKPRVSLSRVEVEASSNECRQFFDSFSSSQSSVLEWAPETHQSSNSHPASKKNSISGEVPEISISPAAGTELDSEPTANGLSPLQEVEDHL